MGKMYYEQLGYDFDPPFYSSTSVPIITNYDRVIRKTPEELVKHLACQWKECKNMDADCEKCLLDWLREEISE